MAKSFHTDSLVSMPQLNVTIDTTRQDVLDYFANGWQLTEMLFNSLTPEAFLIPPDHGLRHQLIFYYGHVAAFYMNKCLAAGLIPKTIDTQLELKFEIGVDEMSWDDHPSPSNDWPSVDDTKQYRADVYNVVSQLILTSPLLDPKTNINKTTEKPLWALMMAFEHERIHLETSSVLIRELPLKFVNPVQAKSTFVDEGIHFVSSPNKMIQVPGQKISIGKYSSTGEDIEKTKTDDGMFGWDNEYGSRQVSVADFKATETMITNFEFLNFVKDNGYETQTNWSSDGWEWKKHRNTKKPRFWVKSATDGSHRYRLRTVFKEINMPWNCPVVVNHYEANAYCTWMSKNKNNEKFRLLTEAEHRVIQGTGDDTVANSNLLNVMETLVRSYVPSSTGHFDVMGNLWEWVQDVFNPLPGFEHHKLYPDFSTPCFDGKHHMIMGGSFISTGGLAQNSARFHFRPHFLQHSGFRMAMSSPGTVSNAVTTCNTPVIENSKGYETRTMVNAYLRMHFDNHTNIKHIVSQHKNSTFLSRMVQCVVEKHQSETGAVMNRALDMGCAVGGATFELAKHFKHVVGIDTSSAFIEMATKIQNMNTGESLSDLTDDTKIWNELPIFPNSISLSDVKTKLNFVTGDACTWNSSSEIAFDVILATNLLCRVNDPGALLDNISRLLQVGGTVLFTTPFSWKEVFTPASKWITDGKSFKDVMVQRNFELLFEGQDFFLLPEHKRKYELVLPLVTVWKKTM
jgi:5-histidylcysteine sulfoxide synthase